MTSTAERRIVTVLTFYTTKKDFWLGHNERGLETVSLSGYRSAQLSFHICQRDPFENFQLDNYFQNRNS